MKSNIKLGFFGILMCGGLCASACVGQVDPPGTEGPVGEAEQALVTCTSNCSGVLNGQSFSQTCNTSCVATNTQITCDGVVTACTSCSANYGLSCTAGTCHCGVSTRHLAGTYDCNGVCQTADYCCCVNGRWC